MRDTKEPEEAIEIIKRYEEISKTQDGKIINIVGKQGQLFKKSKAFGFDLFHHLI